MPRLHARTARRDAWHRDRWVHPPSKRSGRFTKPGDRPRASSLAECRRYRTPEARAKLERAANEVYRPTGSLNHLRLLNPFNPYQTGDDETWPSATYRDNSGVGYGIDWATEPSYVGIATYSTANSDNFITITNDTTTCDSTQIYTLDYEDRGAHVPGRYTTQLVTNSFSFDGEALRQSFQRLGDAAQGAAESMGFMATQAARLGDQITATLDSWAFQRFNFPPDRRAQLRAQMSPTRKAVRADNVSFENCSGPELVALQLLKKMLDEDAWRKYLKYGFVLVEGESGLVYQIRRNEWHVLVYLRGEMVAELCVGLANRHYMPPTDEVIARKLIVECDEADIWRRANVTMRGKKAIGLPRFSANDRNVRLLEGFRQAAVA